MSKKNIKSTSLLISVSVFKNKSAMPLLLVSNPIISVKGFCTTSRKILCASIAFGIKFQKGFLEIAVMSAASNFYVIRPTRNTPTVCAPLAFIWRLPAKRYGTMYGPNIRNQLGWKVHLILFDSTQFFRFYLLRSLLKYINSITRCRILDIQAKQIKEVPSDSFRP